MTQYAITKSISINAPTMRLLLFMNDPTKWPRWSVLKVHEITPLMEDRWALATPLGPVNLRIKRNAPVGIIEYVFTFRNVHWSVPGRVLKNGIGSELVLTLFQPEAVSKERFELFAAIVDHELAWLKKLVELQ